MPAALFFPLLLRLAGPLAFVAATAVAGIMNRSFILVPVIVLTATLTTVLIRSFSPTPSLDMKTMLSPGEPPQPTSPFRGVGRRFGIGLIGYALVFGLSALIAALFQATEFEPQLKSSDVWFLIIPAIIAVTGAWFSARIGLSQMANMMDQMQGMFSEMQARQNRDPADEEAFTVEGEIIDPDKDRS